MITAGNGIYETCSYCGRLVRLNKPMLGSLHLCLTTEERDQVDRDLIDAQERMQKQKGLLPVGEIESKSIWGRSK